MKKLFLFLAAVVTMGLAANAQSDAIGLRFGGGSGFGAEISYQKGLGGNRLEVDLGLSNGSHDTYMHLTGMYHWTMNIVDKLDWYVGPGAQVGFCSNHGLGLSIGGQLGIEYKFSFPLQVSLDVRPLYYLIAPRECGVLRSNFGLDCSLGVRYCF